VKYTPASPVVAVKGILGLYDMRTVHNK